MFGYFKSEQNIMECNEMEHIFHSIVWIFPNQMKYCFYSIIWKLNGAEQIIIFYFILTFIKKYYCYIKYIKY
jgi:hypothetical protein